MQAFINMAEICDTENLIVTSYKNYTICALIFGYRVTAYTNKLSSLSRKKISKPANFLLPPILLTKE